MRKLREPCRIGDERCFKDVHGGSREAEGLVLYRTVAVGSFLKCAVFLYRGEGETVFKKG